ncbi:MAG: hypothetical protein KHY83_06710 [Coriobacteriia bacterium]|nr:hypothetical protein [Coriobacteriia bacterium]MBS5478339.1 hypothetical protein [Coriobacteriia bacterium]
MDRDAKSAYGPDGVVLWDGMKHAQLRSELLRAGYSERCSKGSHLLFSKAGRTPIGMSGKYMSKAVPTGTLTRIRRAILAPDHGNVLAA